jgi:hypothetical protein
MVNFTVVSEYSLTSPSTGGSKKISGGPLYDLERVQGLLNGGTGLLLRTRDCVTNVRELGWENSDVINLVLQLRGNDYIDSEWCENGRGAFAACDAYSIRVKELIEAVNKDMLIEYFVKFAINKLGTMVLTISCHT